MNSKSVLYGKKMHPWPTAWCRVRCGALPSNSMCQHASPPGIKPGGEEICLTPENTRQFAKNGAANYGLRDEITPSLGDKLSDRHNDRPIHRIHQERYWSALLSLFSTR